MFIFRATDYASLPLRPNIYGRAAIFHVPRAFAGHTVAPVQASTFRRSRSGKHVAEAPSYRGYQEPSPPLASFAPFGNSSEVARVDARSDG
ncbi:hypothetical protein WN48_00495 [Eufriesea mexicana]|nr:hypothetical protein WN48_00495 [Eufriesea mexicana]